MSAMMGADPGRLCALQHGDGHRELPRGYWRKRAIAGVQHKTIGVRDSVTVTKWAGRRPDNRDRELEVIAVEAGAGRGALLPVMHASPSRVAK
jgi:hypothetical protein